ncbi:DUF5004 domain-containing protein [Cryomorphaceae bacterium 1068]|nr:DUF5004 domain-containing protein [Cryomorphaceae bacterium 1068]
MKSKARYLYLILFFAVAIVGCKEDDPEIGEPFGKTDGLVATGWVVSQVFLVDEGNPAKPERDISEYYTSGTDLLEIKFEADGTFESFSGDGVNFFPDAGTWSFNDPLTPSSITLVSDDQTINSPLGGPTRIVDSELKMNVQRFCNIDGEEKAVLGYRLVFVRKS